MFTSGARDQVNNIITAFPGEMMPEDEKIYSIKSANGFVLHSFSLRASESSSETGNVNV